MTNPIDELAERVAALEQEVRRLRQEATGDRERVAMVAQDAGAARVLASGADRDVSEVRAELRGHTQVLSALGQNVRELRETQLDHGERLTALEGKVDAGFAKMATGMAQITELLQALGPSRRHVIMLAHSLSKITC